MQKLRPNQTSSFCLCTLTRSQVTCVPTEGGKGQAPSCESTREVPHPRPSWETQPTCSPSGSAHSMRVKQGSSGDCREPRHQALPFLSLSELPDPASRSSVYKSCWGPNKTLLCWKEFQELDPVTISVTRRKGVSFSSTQPSLPSRVLFKEEASSGQPRLSPTPVRHGAA